MCCTIETSVISTCLWLLLCVAISTVMFATARRRRDDDDARYMLVNLINLHTACMYLNDSHVRKYIFTLIRHIYELYFITHAHYNYIMWSHYINIYIWYKYYIMYMRHEIYSDIYFNIKWTKWPFGYFHISGLFHSSTPHAGSTKRAWHHHMNSLHIYIKPIVSTYTCYNNGVVICDVAEYCGWLMMVLKTGYILQS